VKVYEFAVQEGYEWIAPTDESQFEVFRALDGGSRAADWSPVPMRLIQEDEQGRQLRYSDIPWLGNHAPVLRNPASRALSPALLTDGELLPLACDEAQLVVFNVTTVLDALDLDQSDVVRFPSSGRIMKVRSHAFRSIPADVGAFKVPELLSGPVFVTEEVVAAASGAKLRGVGFELLWEGTATGD
jgi:hypothetical protein